MAEPRHAEGCIYCRKRDGGFAGREHPIPESLGNTGIVLEPGVACDRCNNFMSRLDNALLSFMPIRLARTLNSVPTKSGGLPWFEGPTGRIGLKSANNIVVTDSDSQIFERTGENSFSLHVKDGRKLQPHDLAPVTRAVWKAAVGCYYIDHGENVFDDLFDPVREMILGTRPLSGFLLMPTNCIPSRSVTLQYNPGMRYKGEPMCPVTLDVFGIQLISELWRREQIEFASSVHEIGIFAEFPRARTTRPWTGAADLRRDDGAAA